jgi:hypothetical protein
VVIVIRPEQGHGLSVVVEKAFAVFLALNRNVPTLANEVKLDVQGALELVPKKSMKEQGGFLFVVGHRYNYGPKSIPRKLFMLQDVTSPAILGAWLIETSLISSPQTTETFSGCAPSVRSIRFSRSPPSPNWSTMPLKSKWLRCT